MHVHTVLLELVESEPGIRNQASGVSSEGQVQHPGHVAVLALAQRVRGQLDEGLVGEDLREELETGAVCARCVCVRACVCVCARAYVCVCVYVLCVRA